MTITSYAQNFEDVLLWRALHDAEPKSYLDIGAQDPTHDSVSLAFYNAGWRGIHVEPTPYYAALLRDARPGETVIEAAVSQHAGLLEFHEFPETGLSTGRTEVADRHEEMGFQDRKILVPTVRLDNLLERSGDIPWLKIDVEGMEADVLASWGECIIRPWVLVIEATEPNSRVLSDRLWREKVFSRGYHEVYFDGLSRYYVHETHRALTERFSIPPNVFDGFQITERHFSTVELSQAYQKKTEQLEGRVAELGQGAAQLEGMVTELEERLRASSAEHDVALLARAQEVERDCQNTERLLRDQFLRIEQTLRRSLSALQDQLEDNRVELVTLRGRESQHLEQAASLFRDKHETEKRLKEEISSILDGSERKVQLLVAQARQDRMTLEARISNLEERIKLADGLIRKALAEPVGRWHRLGAILGIAGENVVRKTLRSWEILNSSSITHQVEPEMPIAPPVEADEYFQAASLAELLSFEDVEFIRATYETILKREADEGGEAFYLNRLHRGVPKAQVLYEICSSPEARSLPEPFPHLKRELRQFRLTSIFRGPQRASAAFEAVTVAQARIPHVQKFMRYHDEEFIAVIFRYFLNRQPDPSGHKHYISLLRSGISRQQVLLDVSRSSEALKLNRPCKGLGTLSLLLLIEKSPVIGTLISAIRFNIFIKQHLRDLRAMQNHLYRYTTNAK